MRGPKRASKIRKLFNLAKDDDVRKYVNTYRRTFTNKKGEHFQPLGLILEMPFYHMFSFAPRFLLCLLLILNTLLAAVELC
jgi:hypothetical protein